MSVLPRESDAKKPIITPEKKKEQGEDKQFKFDFR